MDYRVEKRIESRVRGRDVNTCVLQTRKLTLGWEPFHKDHNTGNQFIMTAVLNGKRVESFLDFGILQVNVSYFEF